MEITKELFEHAEYIEKEIGKIVSDLLAYNPGVRNPCKKVPLENIQHDIACSTRHLSILYADIGERIKDDS